MLMFPYRWLAFAALCSALFGAGYVKGLRHEKLEHDAATNRAIIAAVAKNEEDRQSDIAQANAVATDYKTKLDLANAKIDSARADADSQRMRLVIPARVCPAPASQAGNSVRTDDQGATETIDLPPTIANGLRDITEDADREVTRLTLKLTALQDRVQQILDRTQ